MSRNMLCKELEKLMYLKKDELSPKESEILDNHLKECEKCRLEYREVSQFIHQSQYENISIDSRFLEARVAETLIENQHKISDKRPRPVRKLVLKALSIASVFFFIIFSVEQVKTVQKISDLEQKFAVSNGTTITPQKQVLVLNHFYDMDDLKQILNSDINNQGKLGSILLNNSSGNLKFKLFSLKDKKLIQQVLELNPVGKGLLNRGFYGNPDLLNLSFDKN